MKIGIALLLLMACSFAYTLTSFNASSSVNLNENGGFSMQVANQTPAENLTGLTVYASILDNESIPIKQLCSYEDSENCYLWTTDQNGKVNGLFKVDNRFVVGNNYTLEVTIASVTQQKNFTVLTMRDLSYTTDWVVWLKNNMYFIVLLLFGIFIVIFFAALFYNSL